MENLHQKCNKSIFPPCSYHIQALPVNSEENVTLSGETQKLMQNQAETFDKTAARFKSCIDLVLYKHMINHLHLLIDME